MATIRDIARNCGVSTATVSKALNGYGDISEATRDRILREASELHYRIDVKKSSPASGKCKPELVGWIMQPDALETAESDCFCLPFFQEDFHRAVEEKLIQTGHDILLLPVREMDSRGLADHIRYRGIRQVVDFSGELPSRTVRELEISGIPVYDPEPEIRREIFETSRRITEHLLELGHRLIFCAVCETSEKHFRRIWQEEIRKGYTAACNAASVPTVFPDEFSKALPIEQAGPQMAAELEATAMLLPDPSRVWMLKSFGSRMSLASLVNKRLRRLFPEVTAGILNTDSAAEAILNELLHLEGKGGRRSGSPAAGIQEGTTARER